MITTILTNLTNLLLFFLHLVTGQAVLQPDFPPKLDSAVNLMVMVMVMVMVIFAMSNPNWSPNHERKQEDLV